MTLSENWNAWGPNGGYLAAIALRAASMLAAIRRPASLYCHFLSSPKFDEVQLDVEFLKQGRRSESLSVQMQQDGKPVLQALVRTAAAAAGYEHQQITMPAVPQPDHLKSYDELETEDDGRSHYDFRKNIEARPTEPQIRDRSRRAVMRDWTRFRPQACFDDPFVDAARSLILLDTYGWPSVRCMHQGDRCIAPNLNTSAWFHQFSPRSEWLLIDHACPVADRGLLGAQGQVWDRQGQVWDQDGNLLATGYAQLCCLPR